MTENSIPVQLASGGMINLWNQIQKEAQTKYPYKRHKGTVFVVEPATIMAIHLLEGLHILTTRIKSGCHLLGAKCHIASDHYCVTLFS